jgi:tetratricopeptide (TPR) repeat protein
MTARHSAEPLLRALIPAVLVLVAVLAPPAAAADPVSVEATVESSDAVVNQSFVFTITVNGAQNVSPPSIYDVDGFDVSYLGPQTQVSFVNGHFSASVSHRYRVVPLRAGDFQLGPFAVDVQGQRYETKPVSIHVAGAGAARRNQPAPGGADGVRLEVAPAKTEVYVGQRVDLVVTLLVGNIRIRDLQYPVMTADGITVEKFSQPDEGTRVINGQRYHAVTLHTTMTPVRSGTIDLAASMTMTALTARRGMDPLFDQFFPGEGKTIEVRSDPTAITVRPLPDQGKPADFSGAVGAFEFTLSAKPTTVEVGDPITVRSEITGSGNLASVVPPVLPPDDRYRAYDAQPVKGEDGAERRVFEQVVLPKVTDLQQLPAVRFSFFDPDAGVYRTITRGPTPITVRAGGREKPEVVEANPPAAEAARPNPQPLGRDIVYIKDAPGVFRPRGEHVYRRVWFVLLQLVPVGLFMGLWWYVRRRERLAADPRLVRFRGAGREARRALGDLTGRTVDDRFYDQLFTAISGYLGAKLGLPPGAIDREHVLGTLAGNGCPSDLRERIAAFFQLVEQARYAPAAVAAAERATALQLATAIVDGLERERRLERSLAARAALVVLAAAALASPLCADEVQPQSAFFAGNQAYAAGQYDAAIRAYESVRDAGRDSAALEFNLGNAYFKAGTLPRAIASYERARRLAPRDPDVQANLAYAAELAQVQEEAPPLWRRLLFPFAGRATGDELAVAASACWWAVWVLLALRLLAPRLRLGLGRAAAVAAAAYLLIAGSFGLRLAETDLRDTAIVIAPGGTSVRFEPSATGTEHFAAAAGTPLDITEQRDEWLQVRRRDGLRGWVPRAAVERLE